jgi:outer membrane protein assembly factor BamB
MRFSFTIVVFLASAFLSVEARAEDWPQWRGTKLDGLSHETGLPGKFSKTENVLWRLPLPGPAGATPIVWENRIFLTSAKGQELILLAVSTDGKLLWEQTLANHNENVRGDEGNFASPSPSTDGEHVWAMMGTGDIGCYTLDGKEIWKFNLQDRVGKFNIYFGMTSTPLLDGDRLYLQLLFTGSRSVLALDKLTGKNIWQIDRKSDARDECEHSYASPTVYRDSAREYLVTHGGDYVVAHRLNDGGEIWRCGGINPLGNYNPTLRFVASPLAIPGLIVVPSAKNGPVLGIDPSAQGNITDTKDGHRWRRGQNSPDVSSPLVYDGLVYLCRENGTLLVLDANTGEQVYEERAYSDRHRASPVYADEKIFLTSRDGTITVVKPGRKFEVITENKMGEPISSSPVVAGGRIYLRSFEALYAIGEK